jgi:hypothetical protein
LVPILARFAALSALIFLLESRSDGGKLASHKVAGNSFRKLIRPERTMDSVVPLGRNYLERITRHGVPG